MTIISKPKTRPKIGTDATTNEDTRAQEEKEQEQEDYKNHRPGILERKLAEMATATADPHPVEDQSGSSKRIRIKIMPIAASRHTAKNNAEETKLTK